MSEYHDIHNNVFKVIQRTVASETEEDRQYAREVILDDLFNIFATAKVAAGGKAS